MPKKKNDPSSRGRRNRKRGHDFERWTASRFRTMGFPNAKRQLEYQIDTCNGVDLAETGPYLIQCKCTANYVPINRILEIKPEPGKIPLLITKAGRMEALAVLPFSALEELIRLAQTGNRLAVTPEPLEPAHAE